MAIENDSVATRIPSISLYFTNLKITTNPKWQPEEIA